MLKQSKCLLNHSYILMYFFPRTGQWCILVTGMLATKWIFKKQFDRFSKTAFTQLVLKRNLDWCLSSLCCAPCCPPRHRPLWSSDPPADPQGFCPGCRKEVIQLLSLSPSVKGTAAQKATRQGDSNTMEGSLQYASLQFDKRKKYEFFHFVF